MLFIVLDDTGFGQLGCFGSPIETPNLDALAAKGLRYNNMHTTALCSPSRSCIITGRNHHSNDMACVTEFATGFPGYDGNVPFENGFLSEILLGEGFNTYMVGKWHLIPASQESGGRSLRPVAARPRLRALLRVPRRRHEPVAPRPRVRQPPGGPAGHPRAGLPPDTGSGRQGHRVHRGRQAGRPQQAVLPPLLPGSDSRAAPRAEGVGRQVRREVRRRVGRLPRRRSPDRRSSASCRPTASSPATTPTCRTGARCRTTSAASTPVRWRCSPGSSATPTTTSAASSSSCAPSASSTTR